MNIPEYETTYIIQDNLKGEVKIYYRYNDFLDKIQEYIECQIPFNVNYMSTKIA